MPARAPDQGHCASISKLSGEFIYEIVTNRKEHYTFEMKIPTKKQIALLAFLVPFVLGGAFFGLGIAAQLFAKPDRADERIILGAILDFFYSGAICGSISLFFCFLGFGIFSLVKRVYSKFLEK